MPMFATLLAEVFNQAMADGVHSGPVTSKRLTYVDISAMHADFCMKFYTTVEQYNVHFTAKFC